MKLFEQGNIGTLKLKNRIVMAAMGNRLIEPDGRLSQRAIDFYVARAKGGTGLIITCGARSRLIEQPPLAPLSDMLMADNKIYINRLDELAEAVHDYGAKVALQITPGQGRNVRSEILRRVGAVAPSPIPAFADPRIKARELSIREIEQLIQAFEPIGELIRDAGIDAIEINAHSGYLCDEFMTALWNKRTDKYGGDLEGRLRFLVELIASVRKGTGADFPIIVKYGLTHYLTGGRDINEGLEIARRLEAVGVDALDIDAGSYETIYWLVPPTTLPPACIIGLAEMVKKAVNIPVMAVGKLGYPEAAERALQEGKADFIALGRALLADPAWANKAREGRLADICPCIGDLDGCRRRIHEGKSISCTVNPATGMERELAISPADKKKSVLVVGGGPAGMEAARVAALRGHKVTLCEANSKLGGNLIPASVPDFKLDYKKLIDYLSNQIKNLGVRIELGTEVTPELIQQLQPDVVLVATGGTAIIPDLPGVHQENVVTAIDVLLNNKNVGESTIVIGGGSVGCETALHLARKGKKVLIVEKLDSVAPDMYSINRMHLLELLAEANVIVRTGAEVLEITGTGLTVADKDGRKDALEAETVILCCGLKPGRNLLDSAKKLVPEVYAIGDCVEPRKVLNAIREGFRVARLI